MPKTIALIDDCEEDRETYKYFLNKHRDVLVHEIDNAQDAIEFFKTNSVDCILLDYQLSDMNALEILQYLPTQSIPTIILTGQGNEQIAAKSFKQGACDYIVKSDINETFLNSAVDQAIQNAKLKQIISQKNEEIQYITSRDSLTDLYSRAFFEELAETILQRNKKQEEKVAILYLDLVRFKMINESYGNNVGDEALKQVAQILKNTLPNTDLMGRLGPDEFVIIIESIMNPSEINRIVDQIFQAFEEPLIINDYTVKVNIQIGIYIFDHQKNINYVNALRFAEHALLEAKKNKLTRCVFYSDELEQVYKERVKIETRLSHGLYKDFYLVFQPQYNLLNHKIISAEVLLRWFDKELGLIDPKVFIPLAEDSGLIHGIGRWVITETAKLLAHEPVLRENGLSYAINISPSQLEDASLVNFIQEVLQEYNLPGNLFEFEITESSLVNNHAVTLEVLMELSKMGCRIAIDDFGVGHSCLSYITNLPVNTLKIDRCFVNNISTDTASQKIVQAIISMATSLDLSVVVEGIETKKQEAVVKTLGGKFGQGFYFHKPVSAEEFKQIFTHTDRIKKISF